LIVETINGDISLRVSSDLGISAKTVNGNLSGNGVVQFDMLAPGTNFCRLETGGDSFTEQFTIVEN
jgi:DUF4097 and DUF4098 domain-containing protein YvlB